MAAAAAAQIDDSRTAKTALRWQCAARPVRCAPSACLRQAFASLSSSLRVLGRQAVRYAPRPGSLPHLPSRRCAAPAPYGLGAPLPRDYPLTSAFGGASPFASLTCQGVIPRAGNRLQRLPRVLRHGVGALPSRLRSTSGRGCPPASGRGRGCAPKSQKKT